MIKARGYTIGELFLEDGSELLFRGERIVDHAKVVIKLPRSVPPTEEYVGRLRNEYVITHELDAPGAVKALAFLKSSEGIALILEDFGGRPLRDLLRAGSLDLHEKLRLACALAGAVGTIHDHCVVHRDIRPENVFIHPSTAQVKLTGFGQAGRLSVEASDEPRAPSLNGTVVYMSPEQTGRMSRAADHRADLYSLGVTIYELLTSTLPFQAQDAAAMVHSILVRTPPSPAARSASVPEVVSDIVMKLLAKAAEDRYQSARGLQTDLQQCLSLWEKTGRIEAFPLGRRDQPITLPIPKEIVGREAELGALLAAFECARDGFATLALASGPAGAGKSALGAEAMARIRKAGGRIAAGQSRQLRQNVPYAALSAALREIVRQMLAEPEEAVERWKADLRMAVGVHADVVIDLIAELAFFIGPKPPTPALSPTQAQNRFGMAVSSLVRALADRRRPLAIFLDDMQWIDPASLKLISRILSQPQGVHILLVGAYRDHEIAPPHPLHAALAELRQQPQALVEIALEPLSFEAALSLVEGALGKDEAPPLTRLLFDKTQGNPLRMHQNLKALHAEGIIAFDLTQGRFRCDMDRAHAAMAEGMANVALADKLGALPEGTRHALQLAACVGHRFDLETLEALLGEPEEQALGKLAPAFEAGIIVAVGGVPGAPDDSGSPLEMAYRFASDRVHAAVYAMTPEQEKQAAHLAIGRRLRDRNGGPAGDAIFDVVSHLCRGLGHMSSRQERIDLAERSRAAGEKAKAATAFASAARYFQAGVSALEAEAGALDLHELSFALHLGLAECEHLSGRFEEAETIFHRLVTGAQSSLERARVMDLMVVLYATQGDFRGAIREGKAALALFGIDLPDTPEQQAALIHALLEEVSAKLHASALADLVGAPEVTSPELLLCRSLFAKLSAPFFIVSKQLYVIGVLQQVRLTLEHGPSALSSFALATCAFMMAGSFGRLAGARKAWALSRAVDDRFFDPELRCKNAVSLASSAHFVEPVRTAEAYYTRGRTDGLMSGDLIYLSYAYNLGTLLKLFSGQELGAVRKDVMENEAVLARTRDVLATDITTLTRQAIRNLQGRTNSTSTLSDATFDEAAFVEKMERDGFGMTTALYHTIKLTHRFIHGDLEGALAAVPEATFGAERFAGFYFTTTVPLFAGLALAAAIPSASSDDRAHHLDSLELHRAKLASWASECPENYLSARLLLDAELARVTGRLGDARELYDEAIAAARESAFVHHEAIAAELAAKLYEQRGLRKIARAYMQDAHDAYARWGALAKTNALVAAYPYLAVPSAEGAKSAADAKVTAATGAGQGLDAIAMIRGAQAIAAEIELSALLSRMMGIVVENAGADRGALLLAHDGQLFLEATIRVEPHDLAVNLGAPLDASAPVAASIVRFVERTKEPVVLGNTKLAGPFAEDPYLESAARSVLAVPMVQKGALTGVLYLENHAARDAFTEARVEVCGVLASLAAIAVENVRMVAELRRRTEALALANERLSEQLRDREAAEAARIALVEELHRAQTPIIPIARGVMVMPLIGTIDESRARQVLETALTGAQQSGARVVIMDITGVRLMDAAVTATLVKTGMALRLLGAQAVITGVRPEAARALVEIDVDLGSIVTLGTLEAGIAYAMNRLQKTRP